MRRFGWIGKAVGHAELGNHSRVQRTYAVANSQVFIEGDLRAEFLGQSAKSLGLAPLDVVLQLELVADVARLYKFRSPRSMELLPASD